MDIYFVMFIFSVSIGIALIVISIIIGLSNKDSSVQSELHTPEPSSHNNSEIFEQRLLKAVDDADSAVEQLNSMSSLVFEELENKYKELLFLYQLIEEKKVEVSNIYSKNLDLVANYNNSFSTKSNNSSKNNVKLSANFPKSKTPKFDAPPKGTLDANSLILDSNLVKSSPSDSNADQRYLEIFSLLSEGKSISQIAKTLNIGQGEVKLILELNKAR